MTSLAKRGRIGGTMDMQRKKPPFSTISGTMVQLGEPGTVAIYRWDDLSWVAHFRSGHGELSDAATWVRANAEWLRARRVASAAVLETVTTLTPEMVERIGALHRQEEAKAAHRAGLPRPLLSSEPAAISLRGCMARVPG